MCGGTSGERTAAGQAIIESGFRRNERNKQSQIGQLVYCATFDRVSGVCPETVRAATGDASIDFGVGFACGAAQILENQRRVRVVSPSMRQVVARL